MCIGVRYIIKLNNNINFNFNNILPLSIKLNNKLKLENNDKIIVFNYDILDKRFMNNKNYNKLIDALICTYYSSETIEYINIMKDIYFYSTELKFNNNIIKKYNNHEIKNIKHEMNKLYKNTYDDNYNQTFLKNKYNNYKKEIYYNTIIKDEEYYNNIIKNELDLTNIQLSKIEVDIIYELINSKYLSNIIYKHGFELVKYYY